LIYQKPRVHPLGDSAITIIFGSERSPELLRQIHAVARSIAAARVPGVEDVVPAYLALTVFYDALHATYDEMAARLLAACEGVDDSRSSRPPSREHTIPVRYDGIDLDAVAAATGLSADEVVTRHTAPTYTVDLLGFVPGWAYLSELDPALQLARRDQPRPRVPAGSVAIAAAQTGIYPLDTPGGWHIIGTTSVTMFDPARDPPALFAAGDAVRFERLR
jgi:KipI family sensor histidine kinase inhibitor